MRRKMDWVEYVLIAVVAITAVLILFSTAQGFAEGWPMWVNTEVDPLNVRDWASTTAPWVYRLGRGEAVTVHEIKGGWAYIEWVGQYGWCWAEYLTYEQPIGELPPHWFDVEED